MPENPYENDDDSNIVRGFEILEENEGKFCAVAKELIEKDSVSFEFMGKRIILTTYGLSYNMGSGQFCLCLKYLCYLSSVY